MLIVSAAKGWFLLIAQRWRATLPCFVGGTLLYLGVAALSPKAYTGTALVGLDPSVNWQPDAASERASQAEASRQASRLSDWAAIVNRLHLSQETVADGRLADAADSLASQVSIQQIDDPKHGGPVVRVRYTAPSGEQALNVTQAVADNLAKPSFPNTFESLATPKLPDSSTEPVAPSGPNREKKAGPQSSPKVQSAARERQAARKRRDLPPSTRTPATELARRLQARVDEGAKLEAALSENSATLSGLQQQLAQVAQKAAAIPPVAKSATSQPERKTIAPRANSQLQNLRQELVRDQQALDDLRKRYTEDYPDVVAAKDKVQGIQMDISRLEAIDGQSSQARPEQAEAPPPSPESTPAPRDESVRNQIVQRLGEAESLDKKLREALERNHAQAAQVQAEVASNKSVDAAIAPSSAPDSAPSLNDSNVASTTLPAAPPTMQSTVVAGPGAANPDSVGSLPASPAPVTPSPINPPTAMPSQALPGAALSLAEGPTVAVNPACFAAPLSWLLSIVFGGSAAFAAAWLAERRDPSIRSERMLRHLLPNSASFLGGIPRVRHEVIPE